MWGKNPETINWKSEKQFEDRIAKVKKAVLDSKKLVDKAKYEIELEKIQNDYEDLKSVLGKEDKLVEKWNGWLFRKTRINNLDSKAENIGSSIDSRLAKLESELLGGKSQDPYEAAVNNMKNPQKPAMILNSSGVFVPNSEYVNQNANDIASAVKSGNQWVINGIAQKICQWQNMAVNAITEHTTLNQKEANLITNLWTLGLWIYLIKTIWEMWLVKWWLTVAWAMLWIWAIMKYMDPEQAAAIAANVGGIIPWVLPNTIKEPESYKKWSELFTWFTNILNDEYKSGPKSQALLAEYIIANGSDYTFDIDKLYNYLVDEKNSDDAKLKFNPSIYQRVPAIRQQYNAWMRDQYNKWLTNFIKENGVDITKDDVRSINSKHQNKLSSWIEQNKANIMAWAKTLGYEAKNNTVSAELAAIYAQKDTLPSANIQAELAKLAKEGKINILSTATADKALLTNTYIWSAKCKDIANIDTVWWADAIVAAKNDVTKFLISKWIPLINFDVINSNWHLYVQSDGMRLWFNIANGQAIIADEPFNNVQATNIEDAIKFGVAMCKMKTFLGKLSAYKTWEWKDKKTVNSRFTYWRAINGMWIKIDESGIDTGTFAALGGDQYINEVNTILDNTRSFANDKSQETAIKALNVVDQEFQQGKRRDEDNFALSYTVWANGEYILHKVVPVDNTANSVAIHGKDIALENFDEWSLRDQIRDAFAWTKDVVIDSIWTIYDGVTLWLTTIQEDFIKRVRNPKNWLRAWYDLWIDGINRLSSDIRAWFKKLVMKWLNSVEFIANRAFTNLFHWLWYTYEEIVELLQKNKILAICVGAIAWFGLAWMLWAGVIWATAIGWSIWAMIAYATATMSKAVTHPR